MDRNQLLNLLAAGPVIAAVKGGDGLEAALDSDVPVIFLLSGDILSVADAAARVRKAGKRVFVHLDLIDGLAAREVSADFIARQTAADGIISTKAALTRRGRERAGDHPAVFPAGLHGPGQHPAPEGPGLRPD